MVWIGCISIYILVKVKKLKELGEANPDPKVEFKWKKFLDREYINFAILLVGGIALIVFLPKLIGGASVDIKSTEGTVITNIALQTVLDPIYFLIGLAGPSALLNFFGTYEKTLLNRIGVSDNNQQ